MYTKLGQNSPKIKELRDFLKNNRSKDLIITDDITILKTAISNKNEIIELFICDDVTYQIQTNKILDEAAEQSKITYYISKNIFDKLATKENHVEFFAIIKLKLKTIDEMNNLDFLVVTDHLEIPGNLGTIYRTLDSASVDGLINVDTITKLTNQKLCSSARGANLLIPTCDTTYEEALTFLLKNDYTIYLGEPNLGHDYKYYDYKGKIAIVVGNERFGINADWYNHKHEKVFIPMLGSNNSLNVGVAASILIYEATMKRKE